MSILDALIEAKAHLYAAQVQRAPYDDNIIAGHIADAERILGTVIADMRRQRFTPPGIRGEDVLPIGHTSARSFDAVQGGDGPDEAA